VHSDLIAPGVPSDLRDLPFHDDGPLTRWLMSGAELHRESQTHVAVHFMSDVQRVSRAYCEVHEHAVPELNLIDAAYQRTPEGDSPAMDINW
jgi:hypothetical protein